MRHMAVGFSLRLKRKAANTKHVNILIRGSCMMIMMMMRRRIMAQLGGFLDLRRLIWEKIVLLMTVEYHMERESVGNNSTVIMHCLVKCLGLLWGFLRKNTHLNRNVVFLPQLRFTAGIQKYINLSPGILSYKKGSEKWIIHFQQSGESSLRSRETFYTVLDGVNSVQSSPHGAVVWICGQNSAINTGMFYLQVLSSTYTASRPFLSL